jgi:hypothetical protein
MGGSGAGAGREQARPRLDLEPAHPDRLVGRLGEQAALGQLRAGQEAGREAVDVGGVQPGPAEVGEARVGRHPLDPHGDRRRPAGVQGEGGVAGDLELGVADHRHGGEVGADHVPQMW